VTTVAEPTWERREAIILEAKADMERLPPQERHSTRLLNETHLDPVDLEIGLLALMERGLIAAVDAVDTNWVGVIMRKHHWALIQDLVTTVNGTPDEPTCKPTIIVRTYSALDEKSYLESTTGPNDRSHLQRRLDNRPVA
jgi:hypothetical protein